MLRRLTPAVVMMAMGAASLEAAVTVDLDLPSAGGTLAVRVFAPGSAAEARYAAGAPVVVWAPGGTEPGSLSEPLRGLTDVVRIAFLLPGGRDAATGRASGGAYDQRGPACIAALRDVVRYAAGQLADSNGRRIDDVVPVPVLHANVGLIGPSNGGNIAVAVAAVHGAELLGHLRYVVQWESPVSSQIATVDLGGVRLDCGGGRQGSLRSVNPYYRGYGPLELDVDYGRIAYDPANVSAPVFLDGDGDGRYDSITDRQGCRSPDLNQNGVLDPGEDFPLAAFTDGSRRVYSRPATRALAARWSGPWPATIATLVESGAYWDVREAVRLYGAAVAAVPGLQGMVLASLVDHVQSAPDHPHVRQAFEGWAAVGAWVQLNPDVDYLAAADPSLRGAVGLPRLAPNAAPHDWSDAGSYCLPETVSTDATQAAAVRQMADRAQQIAGR